MSARVHGAAPAIAPREYSPDAADALSTAGLSPVLSRIFAARGIASAAELGGSLKGLLPPSAVLNLDKMASILADAIEAGEKLLIVADYDSDGATACAIGVRGLRMFGARVEYLCPNRFAHNYGLTPEIVEIAHAQFGPDYIVTVDNGISSMDGVARANELGIKVLVTDHHLAGESLPDATCIVNPNQPGCGFSSKSIAGCGVIFYVLLGLRQEMRARGHFADGLEPNLGSLLDFVALGTVADVVRLDSNNRKLVSAGLARIRAGHGHAGINALMRIAGKNPLQMTATDCGFIVGPRLNAAGRISDMGIGIQCLLTDDEVEARALASRLQLLNQERKEIESNMKEDALEHLGMLDVGNAFSIVVHDDNWHQGVIGIVAARLKEIYHRPCIVFANGNGDEIKASARSITGLHMRDALDLVHKRNPGLIARFGGHAAAAGVSMKRAGYDLFKLEFERAVREMVTPKMLERVIETDGELEPGEMTLDLVEEIDAQVWGQGFPYPVFEGRFEVVQQSVMKGKHLRLALMKDGVVFSAVMFFRSELLPPVITAVYQLNRNEFNGNVTLQLLLENVV